MPKTDNAPTPDTQIRVESLSNEEKHFMEESLSIDKMRLTVTNIYPAFQKNQNRKPDRKSGHGSIRFSKTMRKSLTKQSYKQYDLFDIGYCALRFGR